MKNNNQKGAINPAVLIIIIILILGIGFYIYLQKEKTPDTLMENNNSTTTVTSNTNVQGDTTTITKDESKSLTEDDILTATYKLSANFGGTVQTPPKDIVFKKGVKGQESYSLSSTVFISRTGQVLENPSGDIFEAFWIRGYEFTNKEHTEARVEIGGSFGASGTDNRIFTVTKINGKVETKEVR